MAIRMKSTHALTDKGNIKNDVRKAIAGYVAKHQDTIFAKAEKVADKNVYFVEVHDADGNIIYVNFDVTVSTKAPFDRAERKPRAKADKGDSTIEVE